MSATADATVAHKGSTMKFVKVVSINDNESTVSSIVLNTFSFNFSLSKQLEKAFDVEPGTFYLTIPDVDGPKMMVDAVEKFLTLAPGVPFHLVFELHVLPPTWNKESKTAKQSNSPVAQVEDKDAGVGSSWAAMAHL